MKRISRYGLMLLAVLALATVPSAWATCNLDTQQVSHPFGGYIENCPDALPIEGYAWHLAVPTQANSAGQEFVCRSDSQTIPVSGINCGDLPGSGVAGDGIVNVYIEWGTQNATIVGCPNQAQTGPGSNPMGVQIICNNGASVLYSVGYDFDGQFYNLDLTHPDGAISVSAGFDNGPHVDSVGAGPTPSASNVCVTVPVPAVITDCDPTSFGAANCPDPAARPTPTRGRLMQFIGPCDAAPDLRSAGWTATLVQPDATGAACNVIDVPAGLCGFLGTEASWVVPGNPTPVSGQGILNWVKVGGPAASNDRVKIDSATAVQGKVKVAFSTTNETSIVGFNVYSDGAKLNSSLITSKGVGNNAYVYEVGRGALKGGKSVIVEAVKNDGTVEKTAPVSLK